MSNETPVTQLELIFTQLDGKSLARAQAVCREWRIVAGSLEVRKSRFENEWGIARVTGSSRYQNALEAATKSSFVVAHPVGKHDTIAGLAVKYGCSMMALKVINGLGSEWGLKGRRAVFVPALVESLVGATVNILYSDEASRELFVVEPRAEARKKYPNDDLLEGMEKIDLSSRATSGVEAVSFSRRLIAESLAKELYMDTSAALFYLQASEWDIFKAKRQFLADGCFVQGRRY
ncbi:hypothetical protein BSKO_10518 [Bryopsis sp. KO-2023]|nr:hypothetical protein BSKO_10518 [Bryopsis sp. KO-2023]